MSETNFDYEKFDAEWMQLGKQICQAVYTNSAIQKIKNALQKNGFLTLDEKSEFINICDTTKYEQIYKTYGEEGSDGYKQFSHNWQSWFQKKGVESQRDRGQKSSVDHILFGSTPNPVEFLTKFEEEVLHNKS